MGNPVLSGAMNALVNEISQQPEFTTNSQLTFGHQLLPSTHPILCLINVTHHIVQILVRINVLATISPCDEKRNWIAGVVRHFNMLPRRNEPAASALPLTCRLKRRAIYYRPALKLVPLNAPFLEFTFYTTKSKG